MLRPQGMRLLSTESCSGKTANSVVPSLFNKRRSRDGNFHVNFLIYGYLHFKCVNNVKTVKKRKQKQKRWKERKESGKKKHLEDEAEVAVEEENGHDDGGGMIF